MSDLSTVRELIHERTGIYFRDESMFSLETSVKKRMDLLGCRSFEQYQDKIRDDGSEMNSLVNLITVNETYFLREPAHFDILTEKIFPELLRDKPAEKKIRFLSAGCSTGEEPYSIAIALVEKFGLAILDEIEIFGVDIDDNVIATARAGVYKPHSFRGISSKIRDRYFTPTGPGGQETYAISDKLKKTVKFRVMNLFDKSYPVELGAVNVIFYRNVSIYFSADAQKEIFKNLSNLLAEDGLIFLASSETYFHNIGILYLHEMGNSFVYRNKIAVPVEDRRSHAHAPKAAVANDPRGIHPPKTKPLAETTAPSDHERRDAHSMFDNALSMAVKKEYPAALAAINDIDETEGSFKKGPSLKASILLNMQEIRRAEDAVKTLLALDEWNVEGLLLLGMIEKTRESNDEAVRHFKKAIYIKPQCWLAHFYIAEIFYGTDDLQGAAYEYGVVASILEKDASINHGLTYFPISFPPAQIARLCRRNISKITNGSVKSARG